MAKQRYVNTRFWDDDFVIDLDPIEKLLFLYLLTNPLTEIAGAYEITLKRIAFDTGIDKDMVQKILKRFEDADRVIYRDGWLLVCNFIKHQSVNPKITKGIEVAVNRCPDWVKDRLSIAYDSLSHLNTNSNTNLNTKGGEAAAAESVFLVQITEGVKKLLGLKKLSSLEERNWHSRAELAFQNGFSSAEFLECFSLLRQQSWRSSPVTPDNVHTNLSNLAKLRDEIKRQKRNEPGALPTLAEKHADDAASRKHIVAPPRTLEVVM